MQNLKVVAYLSNGFASNNRQIHLDSILLRQHLINEYGIEYINSFDPEVDEFRYPDSFPILKRAADTKWWYYACSFGQYDLIGEDIQYWHKRARTEYGDKIDFQGRRGKITNKSGKHKAYRMPIQVWLTARIAWYLVGDKKLVEGLLAQITHIGKKVSQGFGKVMKWDVKEIIEDWSEQKESKWVRAVPGSTLKDWRSNMIYKHYAYRPPYWYHENFALCTEVGSDVVKRS